MKKGYARISSFTQQIDRQILQLEEAGCEIIYQETISGITTDKPQWQKMMDELQEGDILYVSDLTRISRSTIHLFELISEIKNKGASLKSLKDNWLDTTSDNPYSQFLLTVMAGVSQLERDLTKMRQKEGIAIAKAKGKYKGRVKKYTDKHKGMSFAVDLYREGNRTVKEICEITQVSRAALYRKLEELEITR